MVVVHFSERQQVAMDEGRAKIDYDRWASKMAVILTSSLEEKHIQGGDTMHLGWPAS